MFEVCKNFFRGPRPKSHDELYKAGIKVVLDLQSGMYEKFHNDAYEAEDADDFGMIEYTARLSDILPPSFDVTRRACNTIAHYLNRDMPVYVHCLHGKDRTGFMVAYYRIVAQKWSFTNAVQEMFSMGFHKVPYLLWVPFLWIYTMINFVQEHHSQDLRDNQRDRDEYVFNKRGWFPSWGWQLCISRNPFKLYKLLALSLSFTKTGNFFKGFSLGFFGIKFYFSRMRYDDSSCRSYGFYFDEEALVFQWSKCDWEDEGFIKFLYYPWSYSECMSQFLTTGGLWFTENRKLSWEDNDALKKALQKTERHPYKYTLGNGVVQEVTATVTAMRYTHWQRWFGLGKYRITPKKVSTSIWVKFSAELGESTGSWKGGTVGCVWDLLPGETFEQSLRRMEKERKFN